MVDTPARSSGSISYLYSGKSSADTLEIALRNSEREASADSILCSTSSFTSLIDDTVLLLFLSKIVKGTFTNSSTHADPW
ncbi:MAG TPA: hypothetical protein VFH28_03505 [Nitrososphaera sp.]|nr:hypothetical protein [Nitrososphaera sp.]